MIFNLRAKEFDRLSNGLHEIFTNTTHEMNILANQAPNQMVQSVHQLRKKLKFLRALLKLTRFCNGANNYKSVNKKLRNSGRLISDCRDAHVRNLLFSEYAQDSSDNPLLERLREINTSQTASIETKLLSENNVFNKIIENIAEEEVVHYFTSLSADNECLILGLSSAYKKCYRVFHSELSADDAELLHEWRKRMKDLQYQLEILKGSPAEPSTTSLDDIVALCEKLGRINDLHMLLDWLDSVHLTAKYYTKIKTMKQEIKSEMKELKKRALKSGHSLLSRDPGTFKQTLADVILS